MIYFLIYYAIGISLMTYGTLYNKDYTYRKCWELFIGMALGGLFWPLLFWPGKGDKK